MFPEKSQSGYILFSPHDDADETYLLSVDF